MTRINVVPVETLTDKHLLAEYKEITRPFNKVIKRIENGTYKDAVIPPKYCLGKGHETFFFDKLGWLYQHYNDLHTELDTRGVNLNIDNFIDICDTFLNIAHLEVWGDYTPTPEDMYLNMARLAKRSNIETVLNELNSDN